jgi:galactokinase
LKALLVLDLKANLREFKDMDMDIDSLTYDELRHWAKWADSVENTMERATNAIALGGDLLTQSNLEPFSRVLVKREDNLLLRAYLRGLNE